MKPNHPAKSQTVERGSEHNPPPSNQRSACPTPPYNPGLQKLVEGKRAWANPADVQAKEKGFPGWHQRGVLPHCDLPGVMQFVTFRLVDSMPSNRHREWEALLHMEDKPERRKRLEAYLDLGHGSCWLGNSQIAQLTEAALLFFHEQRYQLLAWVIMPNHVHVMLKIGETPLSSIVKSWKGFIAREANKELGRAGSFWQKEYWDTLIKNQDQRQKVTHYIENNPAKAGLCCKPGIWPWSSARYRDEYAVLHLPEKRL